MACPLRGSLMMQAAEDWSVGISDQAVSLFANSDMCCLRSHQIIPNTSLHD